MKNHSLKSERWRKCKGCASSWQNPEDMLQLRDGCWLLVIAGAIKCESLSFPNKVATLCIFKKRHLDTPVYIYLRSLVKDFENFHATLEGCIWLSPIFRNLKWDAIIPECDCESRTSGTKYSYLFLVYLYLEEVMESEICIINDGDFLWIFLKNLIGGFNVIWYIIQEIVGITVCVYINAACDLHIVIACRKY